ncbi:hypothetical protein M413DRAFT_444721 [Hebeloma cylindrosporum]|uniref:Uncharacterized protein n=1 Tax=Hebeloma cylindrosporum TaxID=76867 RepID=A0A0C3CDI8_HEBCY|nr:hypothetical protein M413DRAFT_444721 [Hebeloma cylindrosporum h7]
MSLSAKGFIRSVPGASGRFSSSFSINKVLYNASGSFGTTVPEFVSNNATLRYDDIGDLTSTRSFSGRIGSDDVELVFDIGPTIKGRLNMPISPPSTVSGSAGWTQN